jgi:hypothetical protein
MAFITLALAAAAIGAGAFGVAKWSDAQQAAISSTGQPIVDPLTAMFSGQQSGGFSIMSLLPLLLMIPMLKGKSKDDQDITINLEGDFD